MDLAVFALTEDEVRRRKAYLEITPEDERRLREAHPHLSSHAGEIIERFYEYLLGQEYTRSILSAPGLVERLKGLQTSYFDDLTAGTYDVAYFENRLRIGQVHNRVNLSPEWYLGAYNKYLHIASDVLSRAFGRDYERYFQTITSLSKVIYLDMGLAIDAYILSAQSELNGANESLRRMEGSRRQLTDMIVHDLQNPLAGITAFLRHFESSTLLSSGERDALVEALRRCGDLSQMILNVLQVSRAEEGRLQTYIEDVDLTELAREGAAVFKLAAEQEGRAIAVEAPGEITVRTDPSLMNRVLQNLIRNALRHTTRGTSVLVRAEPGRLSVIDDGPGIAPELHPLLFQGYASAQLREAGLRVDSGLGLPFCKVATEAVGARIDVASDGKRGTAFTVHFPAASPTNRS
jgi:signal transduction histidine kinase